MNLKTHTAYGEIHLDEEIDEKTGKPTGLFLWSLKFLSGTGKSQPGRKAGVAATYKLATAAAIKAKTAASNKFLRSEK